MSNPNRMKGEMNHGNNSGSDHRAERFDGGAFFCPTFVSGNCEVVPEAGYVIEVVMFGGTRKLLSDASREPSPDRPRLSLTWAAELSRAGHSTEVRALLQKHGAQKLSEVPESDYARLLYDAEAIANAS